MSRGFGNIGDRIPGEVPMRGAQSIGEHEGMLLARDLGVTGESVESA